MLETGYTAVIGAGLAGLTCARALADAGQRVVVFDKGRGLGGRMASRRADGWRFDHGAVALKPTEETFAAFLAEMHTQGSAETWDAAGGWTGLPGMSGLVKPIAHGLEIYRSARVTGLRKDAQGWVLLGPEPAEGMVFERVILAIPHPQTQALLVPWPALSDQIEAAEMQPCWTLMVGFTDHLETDVAYSKPSQGSIDVIARETAKPGRDLPGDGWVVQASAAWSRAHLERDGPEIEALLLSEFFETLGLAPAKPAISMAHRWRYALTATPLRQAHVIDADLGLAVCGDWCLGNTAQAAFDSANSLARHLVNGAQGPI